MFLDEASIFTILWDCDKEVNTDVSSMHEDTSHAVDIYEGSYLE